MHAHINNDLSHHVVGLQNKEVRRKEEKKQLSTIPLFRIQGLLKVLKIIGLYMGSAHCICLCTIMKKINHCAKFKPHTRARAHTQKGKIITIFCS